MALLFVIVCVILISLIIGGSALYIMNDMKDLNTQVVNSIQKLASLKRESKETGESEIYSQSPGADAILKKIKAQDREKQKEKEKAISDSNSDKTINIRNTYYGANNNADNNYSQVQNRGNATVFYQQQNQTAVYNKEGQFVNSQNRGFTTQYTNPNSRVNSSVIDVPTENTLTNSSTLSSKDLPNDKLVSPVVPPVLPNEISKIEAPKQIDVQFVSSQQPDDMDNTDNSDSLENSDNSVEQQEIVQEIALNDDSCALKEMFKLVRTLRENNPTYLRYNVATAHLDMVSDTDAAYILTSDYEVLPNRISNFKQKSINQAVYQCDLNSITGDNRIVYCKIDQMCNIIRRGEIK